MVYSVGTIARYYTAFYNRVNIKAGYYFSSNDADSMIVCTACLHCEFIFRFHPLRCKSYRSRGSEACGTRSMAHACSVESYKVFCVFTCMTEFFMITRPRPYTGTSEVVASNAVYMYMFSNHDRI